MVKIRNLPYLEDREYRSYRTYIKLYATGCMERSVIWLGPCTATDKTTCGSFLKHVTKFVT